MKESKKGWDVYADEEYERYKKKQMKLRIQFNNKAALKAAETYLTNQNAPFRNSSIDNTYELQFFTQRWADRSERELNTLFSDKINQTFVGDFIASR